MRSFMITWTLGDNVFQWKGGEIYSFKVCNFCSSFSFHFNSLHSAEDLALVFEYEVALQTSMKSPNGQSSFSGSMEDRI